MSDGNWSSSAYGFSSPLPHPLSERKSLNGTVVALTVLLSIMTLVCVLSAVSLFYRSGIFSDAASGLFATEEEASLADAAVMGSNITIFALYVPIAVVFIAWQYRHAKNAQVLSSDAGLGPGWAIAGWFIPVANLVLPAIQIHHSSRARRVPAKPVKPERSALPLIVLWAIALFAGNALSTWAVRIWPESLDTTADLEAAARSDAIDGYASVVLVVAALLCIAMVRSLSKRQNRALDAWQAELYGQPAAYPDWPAGYPPSPSAMPPSATTAQAGRRRRPARRRARHAPEGSPGYRWPAQPVQQDAPWNASDPRTSPTRDLSEPGAPQADWTDPWRQPPGRP